MPDADLQELLTQARSFNGVHNITGVLLYHDNQFVQVLEGDEDDISPLYERIRADLRHTSVIKLADQELAARNFGDWSMAFRPVDDNSIKALAGFAHPEDLAKAAEQSEEPNPLLAQIIRLTFHQEANS